jgi:hypothetical protein
MSTSTPTDFGTDLAAATSLSTTRVLRGDDPEIVENASIRRLTTKKGTLRFHRNYGRDICDMLGAGVTPDQLPRYESEINEQIAEDPRVLSVGTTLTESKNPDGTSVINIAVSGDSAFGPFGFVMTVDKVSLALLNIQTGVTL